MTDDELEFEIDWIPEDTGAPYEMDMDKIISDIPSHTVDKICKNITLIEISSSRSSIHDRCYIIGFGDF